MASLGQSRSHLGHGDSVGADGDRDNGGAMCREAARGSSGLVAGDCRSCSDLSNPRDPPERLLSAGKLAASFDPPGSPRSPSPA
jgi:hypothetical protein